MRVGESRVRGGSSSSCVNIRNVRGSSELLPMEVGWEQLKLTRWAEGGSGASVPFRKDACQDSCT